MDNKMVIISIIIYFISLVTNLIFNVESFINKIYTKKIKKIEKQIEESRVFINSSIISKKIIYESQRKTIVNSISIIKRVFNPFYTIENKNSIVNEIYNKKKKQYNDAISLLLTAAMFYCCIDIFFNINAKIEVLIFLYVLIAFIIILKLLVGYRVKKGYYGTNYEEAKELLYYLIENNDKNNKNSGKKIFNEIDDYNRAKDKISETDGEFQY